MRPCLALAAIALASPLAGVGGPGGAGPQDTLTVRQRGATALVYRRAGVPFKPYVAELRTPAGANVLRDSPADHLHHHGLMFAVRADGVNFWEETPGCGTQVSQRARTLRAGLQDWLEWRAPGAAAPLLLEERRIELKRSPDARATLLAWTSAFRVPRGAAKPVEVTGAHYHGLGMRFAEAMDGGAFENASADPGEVFRGEERLMSGPWCAYRARIAGQPVTVAMFDHPSNPRTVTWFGMPRPFGYLSATLRYHQSPLALRPGQRLTLRYGVAVWDGDAKRPEIEEMRSAWLRQSGGG